MMLIKVPKQVNVQSHLMLSMQSLPVKEKLTKKRVLGMMTTQLFQTKLLEESLVDKMGPEPDLNHAMKKQTSLALITEILKENRGVHTKTQIWKGECTGRMDSPIRTVLLSLKSKFWFQMFQVTGNLQP